MYLSKYNGNLVILYKFTTGSTFTSVAVRQLLDLGKQNLYNPIITTVKHYYSVVRSAYIVRGNWIEGQGGREGRDGEGKEGGMHQPASEASQLVLLSEAQWSKALNQLQVDHMTENIIYRASLKGGPQVARNFCLALPGCCLAKQVHLLVHLCICLPYKQIALDTLNLNTNTSNVLCTEVDHNEITRTCSKFHINQATDER